MEVDGQTAHVVVQCERENDERAVLIDNGKGEAIPCGKKGQKNWFTEGWYYSVNWGGKAGRREYVEAFVIGWGGKGLRIPGDGKYGYLLRRSDLKEFTPGEMVNLWNALERVMDQE